MPEKFRDRALSPLLGWGFPARSLPSDWWLQEETPHRLEIPWQSLWPPPSNWSFQVARPWEQEKTEKLTLSFRRKTLTSSLEGNPGWRPRTGLRVGRVQVRLPQLLFVFFLLGSFPKQTNQGGKMKGARRTGKCRARWLNPGNFRAPLERALAVALFLAGDPVRAKSQTGR